MKRLPESLVRTVCEEQLQHILVADHAIIRKEELEECYLIFPKPWAAGPEPMAQGPGPKAQEVGQTRYAFPIISQGTCLGPRAQARGTGSGTRAQKPLETY